MTVMVVAVPAALVEQQLEATLRVLIVIFDKLLLREAVDHNKQHEFGERFAGRPLAILIGYCGTGSENQGKKNKSAAHRPPSSCFWFRATRRWACRSAHSG